MVSQHIAAHTESVSNVSETRDRLLREAMRLFAQEGINAVSLRRIVSAAGALNASALHYHFGNRECLVEAISKMLQAELEPQCCSRIDALRPGAHRVRDVIKTAFGPVIEMFEDPAFGRDAVCFIGRLGWDFGEAGQRFSANLHRKFLGKALERLQVLMPETSVETLQFRLTISLNTLYYGLSYRSYLRRSPFGELPLSAPGNHVRLREEFLDVLEAGVSNLPGPSQPPD